MVQRWKNWFPRQAPETPEEYRALAGLVSTDGPHYARDACAAGLHLGTVASSDDHTARPGQPSKGLAAVSAPRLDRDAIFEALRNRHTYGTTGQRIYLDFRLNDTMSGQRASSEGTRRFTLVVHGTAPLEWIELLKYDRGRHAYEVVRRWTPGTSSFESEATDPDETMDTLYYVRLEQKGLVDGRPVMAWSSPIWVEQGVSPSAK